MKGVKTTWCRKWKVFSISYKLHHRYCRTLAQFNDWGDLTRPGLFPWNNEGLDARFNPPSGCWRLNNIFGRAEGEGKDLRIRSKSLQFLWALQSRIKYGLTKTATNTNGLKVLQIGAVKLTKFIRLPWSNIF